MLDADLLFWVLQPKQPKVKCPHCLEDINEGATRCKWCTSEVTEESVLPTINMGKEVPAKPVPEKAAPAKNPVRCPACSSSGSAYCMGWLTAP